VALGAVAVCGSLIYGASLAWVLPRWSLQGAAAWLTLSAGLAWCVFIPSLLWSTRITWRECLDACLWTMAAGEVVLVTGALGNGLLARAGGCANAALINALIVALSNIVMAAALTVRLRPRVNAWRTVTLWMLVLNGSGALFFAGLYRFCRLP